MLVAAACAALAACDTTAGVPGPTPSGAESASAMSSGGPATPGLPRIEACDRYIETMQACIAKLPESEKGPRTEALAATKRAWSEPTSGPEGRAQLETTCRAALSALEQAPCP